MITRLKSEYTKKLTPFLPAIAASGKSELQIITMASILEKEAKNAIAQLTTDGKFLNHVREIIRFVKEA